MIMMVMMIMKMMVVMMTHYDIKERYDGGMLFQRSKNGMEKTQRMKGMNMVMIMLTIMMAIMTMMTMKMTMPTMAIRLCVRMDDQRTNSYQKVVKLSSLS